MSADRISLEITLFPNVITSTVNSANINGISHDYTHSQCYFRIGNCCHLCAREEGRHVDMIRVKRISGSGKRVKLAVRYLRDRVEAATFGPMGTGVLPQTSKLQFQRMIEMERVYGRR